MVDKMRFLVSALQVCMALLLILAVTVALANLFERPARPGDPDDPYRDRDL